MKTKFTFQEVVAMGKKVAKEVGYTGKIIWSPLVPSGLSELIYGVDELNLRTRPNGPNVDELNDGGKLIPPSEVTSCTIEIGNQIGTLTQPMIESGFAHEIGHMVDQPWGRIDDGQAEQIADTFAAEHGYAQGNLDFFKEDVIRSPEENNPGDPHPSDEARIKFFSDYLKAHPSQKPGEVVRKGKGVSA